MIIILRQEEKDIASMIDRLMKMSKTNLTKVCKEHKLQYPTTYNNINRDEVKLDFLLKLVKQINPKATLTTDFSLSLMIDEKEVFTQNQK